MTAVECLQFFISTVYFGIAALTIYVYFWLRNIFDNLFFKLDMSFTIPLLMLLIACFAILVLSIVGCCGNCRQSKVLIYLFCFFSGLLLLLVLASGVIGFVYRIEANRDVHNTINQAIYNYNNTGKGSDNGLDKLQNKFECCGADNASDWVNSTYWFHKFINSENKTESHELPKSCCIDKTEECKLNEGNFYEKGCSKQVVPKLRSLLKYAFGFSLGMACIQIIGVIIACTWIGQSRQREIYKYLKINGGTYT